MTPQDYGKLAYQSEFGPEHMAPDRDQCLAFLQEEWEELPQAPSLLVPEPIGNGLCRFPLEAAGSAQEAAPLLAELFLRTAREHSGTLEGLLGRLKQLSALEVPGMADWLAGYKAQGCPPLRHSQAFREAYSPHYRLLKTEYAACFSALLAIHRLAGGGVPVLVAIDGRCGSGKTHFASLIQELFPCRVFHMDDFYLPLEARPEDWEALPGGNMDLPRFRSEVLEPAARGLEVRYRPFDCGTGRLLEERLVPPSLLTVVEGSYSHHPQLGSPYALKIFLTCGEEEQARRLRQREGDYFAVFQRRWIPMEERYHQRFHIREASDLVVNTENFCSEKEKRPAAENN